MPTAPDVHICETGPRDGLQNLPGFVPTAVKTALIDAAAGAGVREIDAGSFVPVKVVPQFADVDAVMAHAVARGGFVAGALAPNLRGAERAIAAGVDIIYFVISASTCRTTSPMCAVPSPSSSMVSPRSAPRSMRLRPRGSRA